jgi:hypothetical protein
MASLYQDSKKSLTLKLSLENRIVYAVDRLKGGFYIRELTVSCSFRHDQPKVARA